VARKGKGGRPGRVSGGEGRRLFVEKGEAGLGGPAGRWASGPILLRREPNKWLSAKKCFTNAFI
jgi:hypothetical protein